MVDARYVIDDFTSVTEDKDGNVYVTRPSGLSGDIHTRRINSPYSTLVIGVWLSCRAKGMPCRLAQVEFPDMSAEDREFLMTGITPEEWNAAFPKNEEEGDE